MRKIKQIVCGICNKTVPSVGMYTHLNKQHTITPDEYVIKYTEYRPSKLRFVKYKENENNLASDKLSECLICKEKFHNGIRLGYHIRNSHTLTKKEYAVKYCFNGIIPTCKCGCGSEVKLLYYYPYKRDYIMGHNSVGENNPRYGKEVSIETRKKMGLKSLNKFSHSTSKSNTKIELEFKHLLDTCNITYEQQYRIDLIEKYGLFDFYLPEIDKLIEIDGDYWHKLKPEKLNFQQFSGIINDNIKNRMENLVRIREHDLDQITILSSKDQVLTYLRNYNYKRIDSNIGYYQVILSKKYLQYYKHKKNDKYPTVIPKIIKFFKMFCSNFPFPPLEESLETIQSTIKSYDYNKINKNGIFSNNISCIGNNYLKHHFKSYWKSKYNGNKSATEAWEDDKIMREVIKYRIGINDSGEVFDFSLHQMVRGLSARRITVSFFKPLLSAAIYKHYLKDKENPTVLDPCCGFGGRLLGFKSTYPNGTYVGCEPNIETYNELLELKRNAGWGEDVKIYNCKFEDFIDGNFNNYDLVFTSIPYYNLEIYSNNIEYKSFDEWKDTFIKAIEKYRGNCYINVSEDIREKLGWHNIDSHIASGRSHFDKRGGWKLEPIVRL